MSSTDLFKVVIWFPIGLMTLMVIFAGVRFRGLGTGQRLVSLITVIALISEFLSRWFWSRSLNNYPVFHIYAPIEYALFASIYSRAFGKGGVYLPFRWSIPVVMSLGVLNALFLQSVFEPNTNVTTLISVILIVSSVTLFFKMLSEMRYARIERSSMFWINIGVLIYFSSSLVLFVFADWLEGQPLDYTLSVWMIHLFFNFLHYLCFTIALWMDPE